jgi:hypothetical protein
MKRMLGLLVFAFDNRVQFVQPDSAIEAAEQPSIFKNSLLVFLIARLSNKLQGHHFRQVPVIGGNELTGVNGVG